MLEPTSTRCNAFSHPQRYRIEALRTTGLGPTGIAKVVGVHKSSISREIRRNSIAAARPPDKYKATQAHNLAARRAYRRLKKKIAAAPVHRRIIFLLKAGWSPRQIAEVCKDRGVEMLSAEGIYRWIYEQRKQCAADLAPLLRRHHRKRRKRRLRKQPRVIIKDRVSICRGAPRHRGGRA